MHVDLNHPPMKKTYLLTLLAGLFSLSVSARDVNNDRRGLHYVSFQAAGGWYTLFENLPDLRTTGAGATTIGVGYEFRYKDLWFSASLDAQYFASMATTTGHIFSQSMYDTQGKQFICHYNIYDDHESLQGISLGLPLMVGAQFLNGFYLGAGVHVQLNAMARAYTKLTYETSATYSRYIADFEDMPNHWYQPYNGDGTATVKVKPQVNLAFEIGYDIFAKNYGSLSTLHPPILKIAAFAEVGVLNAISNEGDMARFTVNPDNPMLLDITPYYRAIDTQVNKFIPFFAGIKLTYLLTIPKRDCRCL